MRLGILLSCVLWALIAWAFMGCAVQKIDLWGAKLEFADGFDIHAGTNQVNQVDNRRGLSTRQGSYIRDVKY